MIKQESIDQLRNSISIEDVAALYTTLKRNGSSFKGLCPFHDERSPSFIVTPAKEIYKCFGCGKSGDIFSIVQEKERMNFFEASEFLANKYNINLDYDQRTKLESQETKDSRAEMVAITKFAYEKYTALLRQLPDDAPVISYLQSRGYSRERSEASGYGYAPADFKFISTTLINMGKFQAAVDCGLITSKEGISKDFYFNRIIIPIHDQNGIIIGLAGRLVPSGDKDRDKKYPKYLNPCESLIYSKKKVWYGLWKAQKAIKELGFAYVVEGYMDVDAMQENEVLNVVSPCGTEMDEQQLKFLKRYTDVLVFGYDGDAAGTKKMMAQIDLALKHDFKTQVLALPEMLDPDEYINQLLLTQNN